MRKWLWIGALLLLAMASFHAFARSRALEALLLTGDMAAGSRPSRLKEQSAAPVRETITYRSASGSYAADVYRPGGGAGARAALVVVPGIVRLGKDDPRIVAFAETMARVRFQVFIPDLHSLRELSIRSADVEEIGALISHVALQEGAGAKKSVGIVAFSYAAGPAILAAMQPETRDLVRFVYAIGGYYDIISVGTYLTTGCFRTAPDERWQKRAASPYATWVFVHSSAAWLDNPADQQALRAMSETKLSDPDADVSAIAAGLGAQGKAVYRLLLNADPEKAPALISVLPASLLAELRRLDLRSKNMADLKAKLILVHGRDDTLIPYSESLALAAAVDGSRLFVIESLAHVDLKAAGMLDIWKLWRASYLLLSERDAMFQERGKLSLDGQLEATGSSPPQAGGR
jgi:pimeloyl-ACP methyl ester carboxylesterase